MIVLYIGCASEAANATGAHEVVTVIHIIHY